MGSVFQKKEEVAGPFFHVQYSSHPGIENWDKPTHHEQEMCELLRVGVGVVGAWGREDT